MPHCGTQANKIFLDELNLVDQCKQKMISHCKQVTDLSYIFIVLAHHYWFLGRSSIATKTISEI